MPGKWLVFDQQETPRCWWCGSEPIYVKYHDQEWGIPTKREKTLFEKVCLEGFQSGLSWITILKKREAFREAFDEFEMERVAKFNSRKVESLLKNEGIIRHRGKIEATINNARQAIKMKETMGSLASFLWQFEPSRELPFDAKRAITPESTEMSRQLKKLGWKFVGPTTCYALMQAMGMVNDHHPECHRFQKIAELRKKLKRPAAFNVN